jgi:hypothetical protein
MIDEIPPCLEGFSGIVRDIPEKRYQQPDAKPFAHSGEYGKEQGKKKVIPVLSKYPEQDPARSA